MEEGLISVERDLLNNDVTALFAVRMSGEVTDKQKAGVLKRFLHAARQFLEVQLQWM